jgi:hypothetical protein
MVQDQLFWAVPAVKATEFQPEAVIAANCHDRPVQFVNLLQRITDIGYGESRGTLQTDVNN